MVNSNDQGSRRIYQEVPSILKDNRGFALILTILIVSLVVVLTLQFNNSMWSDLYSSANLRDGIRLRFIARSGVNCALAVLSEDSSSSDSDSLQEAWANAKELSLNSEKITTRALYRK